MTEITSGDFLAGGGGVTEAMEKVDGLKVRWVLNHDQIAIRTNMHNHKGVKHYLADFYKQDEHEMEKVDFVWASIECTQHSRANGGRDKNIGSYTLGWELIRYLKYIQPLVVGIENVPEFKDWSPINKETGQPDKNRKGEMFEKWKNAICALGYDYHESIRNAADDGLHTRRVRYFAFFTKSHLNMQVNWPQSSHSKTGNNGLPKWKACKDYIDLSNEGNSIFGREFNPNVTKGKRKPLSPNTMKRIAGGIKRYAPELSFIFQYYGTGLNSQSINSPLNTVTTKDRHVLVTLEKAQFIADYYGRENTAHSLEGPANTITTENSKHIVSAQLMVQHYSGDHSSSVDAPLPTITTKDHNSLITSELKFVADHCHTDNFHTIDEPLNPQLTRQTKQFISLQYNSNGNPAANNQSIDEPLKPITTQPKHQFISHHFGTGVNQSINEPINSLTTHEKVQFISAYFSAGGKPESQNQSLENPLNAITTGTNKQALITAIEKGELNFDIKMRFLDPEELAQISSFPAGYFTDPLLKLTKKDQVKLIGNAVPPKWAEKLIKPVITELQEILEKREAV